MKNISNWNRKWQKTQNFPIFKVFYATFVKFSTDFVDWNVEKSQQGTNLLSSSLFRRDLGRKISRWSAGVLFNFWNEICKISFERNWVKRLLTFNQLIETLIEQTEYYQSWTILPTNFQNHCSKMDYQKTSWVLVLSFLVPTSKTIVQKWITRKPVELCWIFLCQLPKQLFKNGLTEYQLSFCVEFSMLSFLVLSFLFLVDAFSLKEKSPTITVGSFFQLTISLWMVHFSYNSYNFSISYNSYLANEVVFLHHLRNSTGPKDTSLEYFRLCETFSRIFFTEGPHRQVFYFQTEWMLKNPKGSPLSGFFGIERLFQNFS